MDIIGVAQYLNTPATVVHVLAVVFGMGGALVSDILFSFFSKDKNLNETEIYTLSILKTIVFYALLVIAFSGFILFLSDIERYMSSAKFLSKMSILAVLIINGYILNKVAWPRVIREGFFTNVEDRNMRRLAFACGAVSVISWLSVLTLGVLNRLAMSYGLIMSLYLGIIIFGIIVALFVEKKELN